MIEIYAEKIPGWVRIVLPVFDENSLVLSEERERIGDGVDNRRRREATIVFDRTFYVDPRRVGHPEFNGTRLVQDALDAAANLSYWALPTQREATEGGSAMDHHVELYFSKDLRSLLEDFEAEWDDQLSAIERYWYDDMQGYRSTWPQLTAKWFDTGLEPGESVDITIHEPLAFGAEGGEPAGEHRTSLLDDLDPLISPEP